MTKIEQEIRPPLRISQTSLIAANRSLRRQAVDLLLNIAELRESMILSQMHDEGVTSSAKVARRNPDKVIE